MGIEQQIVSEIQDLIVYLHGQHQFQFVNKTLWQCKRDDDIAKTCGKVAHEAITISIPFMYLYGERILPIMEENFNLWGRTVAAYDGKTMWCSVGLLYKEIDNLYAGYCEFRVYKVDCNKHKIEIDKLERMVKAIDIHDICNRKLIRKTVYHMLDLVQRQLPSDLIKYIFEFW